MNKTERTSSVDRSHQLAGRMAISGALVMIAGAVCHSAFGADLFLAMDSEDRVEAAQALTEVAAHRTPLLIGTWLWVLGASTMCLAGVLLVRRSSSACASVARWALAAATGAVIVFFSAMIGIIEGLAPAHAAGEDVLTVTRAMGIGATTADWITTAVILGLGYWAVVFSGRNTWAPSWLLKLAAVSLAISSVTLATYPFDIAPLGFVDVIVGLATVIATGVVVSRHRDESAVGAVSAA